MTRLAVLYMTDQDPPDEVTIVDLLEAAVEQGDEDAEEILQNLRDDILPEAPHLRTPCGQITTRTVWSRMIRSSIRLQFLT